MKNQRRRILLLMDNAPSHRVCNVAKENIDGFEVYRLQHVTVLFLPANTTSVIQPLDAGIIAAFKAHYRRYFLEWHLGELDAAEPGTNLSKIQPNVKQASFTLACSHPLYPLGRKRFQVMALNNSDMQAIIWSQQAWDKITEDTISNCWRKTAILPSQEDLTSEDAAAAVAEELAAVGSAVGELIGSLNLGDDALQAAEFVELPGEEVISADLTDEELLKIAQVSLCRTAS